MALHRNFGFMASDDLEPAPVSELEFTTDLCGCGLLCGRITTLACSGDRTFQFVDASDGNGAVGSNTERLAGNGETVVEVLAIMLQCCDVVGSDDETFELVEVGPLSASEFRCGFGVSGSLGDLFCGFGSRASSLIEVLTGNVTSFGRGPAGGEKFKHSRFGVRDTYVQLRSVAFAVEVGDVLTT
jgi:hypothetical protein